MKEQAPCKDCPDRVPASENTKSCHVTCEKYKAFSDRNLQNNLERLKELKNSNTFSPQLRKMIYRNMRWK